MTPRGIGLAVSKAAGGSTQSFNEQELSRLIKEQSGGACISVYTNSASGPRSGHHDWSRLRKLLRAAEPELREFAVLPEEAEELFSGDGHFADDSVSAEAGGRAIFASKDFFASYRVKTPFPPRVVVGPRFYVRPLVPFTQQQYPFFILALSQKHVRLLEASGKGLSELTIRDVPEHVREEISEQAHQKMIEFHSAGRKDGSLPGVVFHGTEPNKRERLVHFLREVDAAVCDALKGKQAPLVVAAVDYVFAAFHSVSTYAHLLGEHLSGNPDLSDAEALRHSARELVAASQQAQTSEAVQRYRDHINTARTSSNLAEIIQEASRGRVQWLLIPEASEVWGTFTPPETAHAHAKREPRDEELINLAVSLTIETGGKVHVVPEHTLPVGAPAGALYKF